MKNRQLFLSLLLLVNISNSALMGRALQTNTISFQEFLKNPPKMNSLVVIQRDKKTFEGIKSTIPSLNQTIHETKTEEKEDNQESHNKFIYDKSEVK